VEMGSGLPFVLDVTFDDDQDRIHFMQVVTLNAFEGRSWKN